MLHRVGMSFTDADRFLLRLVVLGQGRILAALGTLTAQEAKTMALIDDLEAEVRDVRGAEDSAATLLSRIHQELQDALTAGDPARLQKVLDDLKAGKDALAAAVAANPDPNPAPSAPPTDAPPTA